MREKYRGFDVYTIVSTDKQTKASFVPEKGGVGSSIIMPFQNQARELLFQHEHFWERNNPHIPGGWPFLFPICARIERMGKEGDYLYDGKIYHLPIHGFGPRLPWQVEKFATDSITLMLKSTEETLKNYPFRFQVKLNYQVKNKEFICTQKYINLDDKALPYYAGFHPYFLTPPVNQGKEKVILNFKPKRGFIYNEHLTDLIGEKENFNLPSSITNPELNEQISELGEDKEVTLSYPDGLKISLSTENENNPDLFRYLQLYHQVNEPFFCVEPWMGFPNALNTVLGVRWIAPRQSEIGVLRLRI